MAKNDQQNKGPGVFVSIPSQGKAVTANPDGTFDIKVAVGLSPHQTSPWSIIVSIDDEQIKRVNTSSEDEILGSGLRLKAGNTIIVKAGLAGTAKFDTLKLKVPAASKTSGLPEPTLNTQSTLPDHTGKHRVFVQRKDKREGTVMLTSPKVCLVTDTAGGPIDQSRIPIPQEGLWMMVSSEDEQVASFINLDAPNFNHWVRFLAKPK